jgi:peptidyl-prolyl cis-trans isomerase A (cyclophilin A)
MIIRFAALALLFAAPAFAQTVEPQPPAAPAAAPASTPAPAPAPHKTVLVRLTTSAGPIAIAVETERAPITAANFLRYVDQKRFDGTTFYRAVKVQPGYGLIQGGANNDPKKVLKPIAHEPTSKTGLSHVDGAVSMARAAPGTASGDFFIVIGGFPTMDADPKAPGDNLGYAVFGRIVEGMDVVKATLEAPTKPGGPAAMQGQILAAPIKIITARRAN